ncbi:MAG: hypothetical protein H6Q86_5882 [candidate division NC10 bacterium]|nr:hypothetical protein [candidate division NC10 bacterium]
MGRKPWWAVHIELGACRRAVGRPRVVSPDFWAGRITLEVALVVYA